MNQYRIAVLVGSLRKESFNRKLAEALMRMGPSDFIFQISEIGDLPLYNQDDDENQAEAVKRLKAEVTESHGVLFVTPEYNRSLSGVLKNAIDHASRPYKDNSWKGKAAGMVGISTGCIGTAIAQQHLRNIMAHLDAPMLGQPEMFLQATDDFFDSTGAIGPKSRRLAEQWIERYVAWVKVHGTGR